MQKNKIKEIISKYIKTEDDKNIIYCITAIYILLFNIQILAGNIMLFSAKYLVINFLIILALIAFFMFFTKNIKKSIYIVTIFTTIFCIINYIINDVKGTPLSFADLFQINSAFSVIDNYKVRFNINFYIFIIVFLFNIFFIKKFIKKKSSIDKLSKKTTLILSIIILSVIYIFSSSKIYFVSNKSDAKYGTLYRFMKSSKNLWLSKPNGYSEEKVLEILKKYHTEDSIKNNANENPNIIVIMNESLSDINRIYKLGLEDNLSYIRNLSNNKLYASTYGNKTANSEFEFLTGFSTAFYGKDIIPYQKYINTPINSLVDIMKSNGYTTYAMHLYNSSNYNRKNVYKYLGFDNIIFDDSYNNMQIAKIRNNDLNTYKKIIDIFENKDDNQRIFNFTVTIQNHLPNTTNFEKYKERYPNYANEINEFQNKLNGKKYCENETINNYLQYAKLSDEAVKYLIEYFENYDEKTIILFFGDHQPNINNIFLGNLNNYQVAYFIWNNYGDSVEEAERTSINYLSTLLLNLAKLDSTDYINFLNNLKKEIPVIISDAYYDKNYNKYDINDKNSSYYKLIQEYQYLQYYFMTQNK